MTFYMLVHKCINSLEEVIKAIGLNRLSSPSVRTSIPCIILPICSILVVLWEHPVKRC